MSNKPSILLVEDEENLHEALKLNLELEGYQVTSAFDGIEAMKAVQNEYFDLIILDVMMPIMDGLEVCREVKKISPTIPVILLTARDDMVTRAAAMDLGVSEFIAKPVNNADLLNRVRTQLSNVAWDKAADQAVAKMDKAE